MESDVTSPASPVRPQVAVKPSGERVATQQVRQSDGSVRVEPSGTGPRHRSRSGASYFIKNKIKKKKKISAVIYLASHTCFQLFPQRFVLSCYDMDDGWLPR